MESFKVLSIIMLSLPSTSSIIIEGSFQPQVHMVSATEYFFSDATDEEVLGADFYANIFVL